MTFNDSSCHFSSPLASSFVPCCLLSLCRGHCAVTDRLAGARSALSDVQRGAARALLNHHHNLSSPVVNGVDTRAHRPSAAPGEPLRLLPQRPRGELRSLDPPDGGLAERDLAVFRAFEGLGDEMRFLILQTMVFLEDLARFKLERSGGQGGEELRLVPGAKGLHALLLSLDWENPNNPRRAGGYGLWSRLSTAAYTHGRSCRCVFVCVPWWRRSIIAPPLFTPPPHPAGRRRAAVDLYVLLRAPIPFCPPSRFSLLFPSKSGRREKFPLLIITP